MGKVFFFAGLSQEGELGGAKAVVWGVMRERVLNCLTYGESNAIPLGLSNRLGEVVALEVEVVHAENVNYRLDSSLMSNTIGAKPSNLLWICVSEACDWEPLCFGALF